MEMDIPGEVVIREERMMEKAKWGVAVMVTVLMVSLPGRAMGAGQNTQSLFAQGLQVQTPNPSACSMLSAADAQKIMGVPMQLKKLSNPSVCLYEEAAQRPNAMGKGTVSLAVNKRSSKAAEDAGWAQLKETRHLKAGEKNVQALSGFGEEAYFTGNTVKGKAGVSGVIVRKGNSNFMLDVMVMEYVASPEEMKNVAMRIADGMD
jgi:hypothetical protein